MRKLRGFTLVELLVVISIIALLLSILMPSLSRARQQARKVVCLTNTHQLSIAWTAYTTEYRGKIPTYGGNYPADQFKCWNLVIKPYLGAKSGISAEAPRWGSNLMKVMICPEARGFQYTDSNPTSIPAKYAAWGWLSGNGGKNTPYMFKNDYGCYGINKWVEDIPSNDYWRSTNVPGAARVPFIFECLWPFAAPGDRDDPPAYDGQWDDGGWGNMKRVVINRHQGDTTGLFLDLSGRSVGLKELWTLKWSRNFNIYNAWTAKNARWKDKAPWMGKFKSYANHE